MRFLLNFTKKNSTIIVLNLIVLICFFIFLALQLEGKTIQILLATLSIFQMLYLGNSKILTISYLILSAFLYFIISIISYKLVFLDKDTLEFLILLFYSSSICAGPFRFFTSEASERKMQFVFLISTYTLILITINQKAILLYAMLSAIFGLLLYIFKYKKISSLLLSEAFMCLILIENSMGYLEDKNSIYSLVAIFILNLCHLVIFNSRDDIYFNQIKSQFKSYYKNSIDFFYCLVPLITGLNIVSVSISSYLLFLLSIQKYTKTIEEFTYSSFKDLWDDPFETDFMQYMPGIPEISFKIKLNLSFTITLIFVIIAFLIWVCDV